MTNSTPHLWEVDHPYYWTEGSYHANGWHQEHESWESFLSEMGDADDDYNLLARWDWKLDTDDDGKPVIPVGTGVLKVRYVLQRKGAVLSRDVRVCPEDEPAVREWLQRRWEYMRSLWAPFAG